MKNDRKKNNYWFSMMNDIREVKIYVYVRPVTANAKLQVVFSGEVFAVRN